MPSPEALDQRDPLAAFRNRFIIDDPQLIYLDGNSLGRLPRETSTRLREVIDAEWGHGLVRSWNAHWMALPRRIGGKIAQLIGADPDEVVIADATSVNLFKLVLAALRARPGRKKIVTDDLNFPSDVYVLQAAVNLMGDDYQLEIVPSPDGLTVASGDLQAAIDANTALVELSHTTFKSGFIHDMNEVTAIAHQHGAWILWDLSHSVGSMPVSLRAAKADLAVGCTYKYLNGGPGAPAFLYVQSDLLNRLQNPVAGWFGHVRPFEFSLSYEPVAGILSFVTGTPTILSLAGIEPGVDIVLDAGLDQIRAKSKQQTDYLIALWEKFLAPIGYQLRSPRDSDVRGSHVSLGHDEGLRIARALIDRMGVVPDFRAPDDIRLGIAPLYTSYAELHAAVMALRTVS